MRDRDRRALLIGAVAIVIAYGVFRGVPRAVVAVSTLEDHVRAQSTLLQSARLQASRREELSDSLDLLRDAVGRVTAQLLEARTAEDAATELTSRITVVLSRHPVRLDGVRPVSDSSPGVPARVRAGVAFEGDVRGLASALRELESDVRIGIERIDVTVFNPSVGDTGAEVLRAEVEVEGFFVAGETDLPPADSVLSTGGAA